MRKFDFLRAGLKLALMVLMVMGIGRDGWAQVIIAQQDFEATALPANPYWPISSNTGATINTSQASQTPANQTVRNGTKSWQVKNATGTLALSSVSVSGYSGVSVTIYLSSTSATTGNGADANDYVRIFTALNGGNFATNTSTGSDLSVNGAGNARWGYSSTGISTNSGTNVSVVGAAGTNVGTIYSKLVVNIPDGTTAVALRINALNDDANEFWNIDDISISGTIACTPPTITTNPTDKTVCTNTNVTFSAATSTSSPSYQWESSANGSTGWVNLTDGITGGLTVSGATTAGITISSNTATTVYVRSKITANSCTATTTSAVFTVNGVPAQPSVISGSATPCANGSTSTYSVTLVSGVTYAWLLPTGWAGTSTTNSITTTPGTTAGSISVTPSNGCGDGLSRTLSVTPNAVAANVTGAVATVANQQSSISWTAPSCYSEVLVVASEASANNGVPSGDGSAYAGNLTFGSGTVLGNGFVVYKGTSSPQVVTGLTNNTAYYFKIFTRNGSNWSAGVEVSAVPTLTYCVGTFSTGCGSSDFINNFSLNTLVNNGTGCNGLANSYINYPVGTATTSVRQGVSYTAALTSGSGSGVHSAAVWIDFNQDGDFSDANEFFTISNAINASSSASATVQIPATATLGQTRLRVRYIYYTNASTIAQNDDCSGKTYGETEDYTITIIADNLPTLSTTAVSNITINGATSGGTITADGGSVVTARGVVWSTTTGPTVALTTKTLDGTGTGTFTSSISGLVDNTVYYLRSYATNANGTSYGDELSFTTATVAAPIASAATSINDNSFTANWDAVTGASSYQLDVSTFSTFATAGGNSTLVEGFNAGTTAPSGWTFSSGISTYTSTGNYGISSPSLQFNTSTQQVTTPILAAGATQLQFWIKGNSTNASSALLVEGYNGASWVTLQNITSSLPTTGTTYTYNSGTTPTLPSGLTQFRFTYTKGAGNLAFDDVSISYNTSTPSFVPGYNSLSVSSTSQAVVGITANTPYYYRVRAVGANGNSANSNVITATPQLFTQYRSAEVGNYDNTLNWQGSIDGTTWVNFPTPPPSGANVTIQNGFPITLVAPVTVGSLTLSDKLLSGANDLTATAITGASSSAYIVTSGIGKLIMSNVSASRLFPIGTATSYNPVTITNPTAATFAAKVSPTFSHAPQIPDRAVDREWDITRTGTGEATLTFQWQASDEHNQTTTANKTSGWVTAHYNSTTSVWEEELAAVSGSGPYTITRTKVDQFSPFAVGLNGAFTGSVLPINLLSFNAFNQNGQVMLQWKVAADNHIRAYEIEKGIDGSHFTKIGTLAAAATHTEYNFTDGAANGNVLYYRLKMIDQDGHSTYGKIIAVSLKKGGGLQLLPNPVRSTLFATYSKAGKNAALSLLSINGSVIGTYDVPAESVQYSVNTSALAPGTYLLKYTNNGVTEHKRFIKL